MSEVQVFDLENFLPLKIIRDDGIFTVRNGTEIKISSFNSDLEKKVEVAKKKFLLNLKDEDTVPPSWVNGNLLLGRYGELIAIDYLNAQYGSSNIKDVSKSAYYGCDIMVKFKQSKNFYEVKTSKNHNVIYLTHNEMNKSKEFAKAYNVFFIKVDEFERSITGYVINDPVQSFGIQYDEIIKLYDLENIVLLPNKFKLEIKQSYLNQLKSLDLSNYIDEVLGQ